MSCKLGILDLSRFAYMASASILLIIGDILLVQHWNIGVIVTIIAWLYISYNLYIVYPDKFHKLLPVLGGLCLTQILLPTSEYAFLPYIGLWCTLGYLIHEWIGLSLGFIISSGYTLLLPWQRKYGIVDGLGYPLMTAGLIGFSTLYSIPDKESLISNYIPCIDKVLDIANYPQYTNSVNCVLESGCFNNLSSLDLTDPQVYIPAIVDAIACAGDKCAIYADISRDIECYIEKCLPAVISGKPTSAFAWASAILSSYVTCGIPTCKM